MPGTSDSPHCLPFFPPMIKKNSLNFLPESSPTSLPQPKSCSTLRAPFWSSCSSSHSLLRTLPSLILSADSRAYSGTPRLKKKTQKIKRLEIYVTKLPLSQSLLIVIYSLLDRHAFWAFDELPQSFFTFKPCHLHKELINDHAHKCGLSVLWFPLLNALQFLATPVTHSRSWTLPLPLASREKKKRVKKNRYPFSVLQADQDLDRSGLTLSVITCFLTLTSVLFVNIFKSFASNPCPCINPPRLQLTESFVMCHC